MVARRSAWLIQASRLRSGAPAAAMRVPKGVAQVMEAGPAQAGTSAGLDEPSAQPRGVVDAAAIRVAEDKIVGARCPQRASSRARRSASGTAPVRSAGLRR